MFFIKRLFGDLAAIITGDLFPPMAPLPPRPVPYRSRPGGLTERQLQWCRDNIAFFATCERQAAASKIDGRREQNLPANN